MAKLRTARSTPPSTGRQRPPLIIESGGDDYSAKHKPRNYHFAIPRWLIALLLLALSVALWADRRKRLIWEGAVKEYLEPPPVGIRLTDLGTFNASGLTDADPHAGAGGADLVVGGVGVGDVGGISHVDDDPDLLADHLGAPLHVVFSTDCSTYQHWQSYLLFYSALRSRQPGIITRIASGCSDEESASVRQWFDEHVATMSERFKLHFTPQFSRVQIRLEDDGAVEGGGEGGRKKEKNYKYFNKPFGLRHWMEHGPDLGLNSTSTNEADNDEVVILLDPDMIILRPITTDFSVERDVIVPKRLKPADRKQRVERGVPFGQAYGMGAKWKDFDLDSILGGPDVPSPARTLPRMEGLLRYAVGPPYIATAPDMYKIATKWTDFVPSVYAQYPKLLAEMYGYCVAAAHLELPHQKVESLMVSDVVMNCEGWDFVENLPDGEVCSLAARRDAHDLFPVPNVMHYCQAYKIDDFVFHKRRVSHNFFSCDGAAERGKVFGPFVSMEDDADLRYNTTARYWNGVYKVVEMNHGEVKREVFALCTIRGIMNEALAYYRDQHCLG